MLVLVQNSRILREGYELFSSLGSVDQFPRLLSKLASDIHIFM